MWLARFVGIVVLLAVTIPRADTISGTWNMKFDVPSESPTCCDSFTIILVVSGTAVTGKILMGDDDWPGTAPIKEGTFKDGHLVLRALTDKVASTGRDQLDFDGSLVGDSLKGSLTARTAGANAPVHHKWEVTGKKQRSESPN